MDQFSFVDTHCHLDFPSFDQDRKQVIEKAKKAKVKFMINCGFNLSSSQKSIGLAHTFSEVYATVGIHPNEAVNLEQSIFNVLENKFLSLTKNQKVVALGECGLDYFRSSNKDAQKELFSLQVKIANQLNLPIIIHSRDSFEDIITLLNKEFREGKQALSRCVFHCWLGNINQTKKILEQGGFFSLGGALTYPKNEALFDMVRFLPEGRFFLETDAPLLAPQPVRGQRNEPKNIIFTAQLLAQIRKISLKNLAQITTEAAKTFFKLNL